MTPDETTAFFTLFNEVAIIEQLSRALLEAQLPDGMIAPHFAVLNHLVRVQDGRTPLDLARAFQVPKTSMTHTLAGLGRTGLVDVRPHPRDGRSKQVWITDAGRATRERAIADMVPDFTRIGGSFDPAAVQAMLPALTRLREVLDTDRDA